MKRKKLPKHFWNYRLVRRVYKRPAGSTEVTVSLHEAHYEFKGTKKSATVPIAITLDPVTISGETKKEMAQALEWAKKALRKPVLKYEDFVKD